MAATAAADDALRAYHGPAGQGQQAWSSSCGGVMGGVDKLILDCYRGCLPEWLLNTADLAGCTLCEVLIV